LGGGTSCRVRAIVCFSIIPHFWGNGAGGSGEFSDRGGLEGSAGAMNDGRQPRWHPELTLLVMLLGVVLIIVCRLLDI
jgi:hypothetical protein